MGMREVRLLPNGAKQFPILPILNHRLWLSLRHPHMESTPPRGISDGVYRCLPPWHPDDPADTRASAKKLYLATGPKLGEKSGGYNSWNSANAVVSKSPGATAPRYDNWRELVDAWQAGCDRGEHDHDVDPKVLILEAARSKRRVVAAISGVVKNSTPSSPSPKSKADRSASNTPTARLPAVSRSRLTSVSTSASSSAAAPLSPSLSASLSTLTLSETPTRGSRARQHPVPPSLRSYGLRWGENSGLVCGSLEEADRLYGDLDLAGLAPRMLTTGSFIDAACFAEGFSLTATGEEAGRRARWIATQQDEHQGQLEAERRRREEYEKEARVRAAGKQNRARRRRVVKEAYELRQWEEVARLRQRVARLEAEAAGGEFEGSSSYESLDEEALEAEGTTYSGYDTDDVVSEVESRKEDPKHWRTMGAAWGGLLYRTDDEYAHLHRVVQ
ncbi:hypothetical protein C8R47DRAFT_1084403 [Mycena vitilis]|nr:hypothetical protein C8R47DRAFT_1084403 [Mycena vitilis]